MPGNDKSKTILEEQIEQIKLGCVIRVPQLLPEEIEQFSRRPQRVKLRRTGPRQYEIESSSSEDEPIVISLLDDEDSPPPAAPIDTADHADVPGVKNVERIGDAIESSQNTSNVEIRPVPAVNFTVRVSKEGDSVDWRVDASSKDGNGEESRPHWHSNSTLGPELRATPEKRPSVDAADENTREMGSKTASPSSSIQAEEALIALKKLNELRLFSEKPPRIEQPSCAKNSNPMVSSSAINASIPSNKSVITTYPGAQKSPPETATTSIRAEEALTALKKLNELSLSREKPPRIGQPSSAKNLNPMVSSSATNASIPSNKSVIRTYPGARKSPPGTATLNPAPAATKNTVIRFSQAATPAVDPNKSIFVEIAKNDSIKPLSKGVQNVDGISDRNQPMASNIRQIEPKIPQKTDQPMATDVGKTELKVPRNPNRPTGADLRTKTFEKTDQPMAVDLGRTASKIPPSPNRPVVADLSTAEPTTPQRTNSPVTADLGKTASKIPQSPNRPMTTDLRRAEPKSPQRTNSPVAADLTKTASKIPQSPNRPMTTDLRRDDPKISPSSSQSMAVDSRKAESKTQKTDQSILANNCGKTDPKILPSSSQSMAVDSRKAESKTIQKPDQSIPPTDPKIPQTSNQPIPARLERLSKGGLSIRTINSRPSTTDQPPSTLPSNVSNQQTSMTVSSIIDQIIKSTLHSKPSKPSTDSVIDQTIKSIKPSEPSTNLSIEQTIKSIQPSKSSTDSAIDQIIKSTLHSKPSKPSTDSVIDQTIKSIQPSEPSTDSSIEQTIKSTPPAEPSTNQPSSPEKNLSMPDLDSNDTTELPKSSTESATSRIPDLISINTFEQAKSSIEIATPSTSRLQPAPASSNPKIKVKSAETLGGNKDPKIGNNFLNRITSPERAIDCSSCDQCNLSKQIDQKSRATVDKVVEKPKQVGGVENMTWEEKCKSHINEINQLFKKIDSTKLIYERTVNKTRKSNIDVETKLKVEKKSYEDHVLSLRKYVVSKLEECARCGVYIDKLVQNIFEKFVETRRANTTISSAYDTLTKMFVELANSEAYSKSQFGGIYRGKLLDCINKEGGSMQNARKRPMESTSASQLSMRPSQSSHEVPPAKQARVQNTNTNTMPPTFYSERNLNPSQPRHNDFPAQRRNPVQSDEIRQLLAANEMQRRRNQPVSNVPTMPTMSAPSNVPLQTMPAPSNMPLQTMPAPSNMPLQTMSAPSNVSLPTMPAPDRNQIARQLQQTHYSAQHRMNYPLHQAHQPSDQAYTTYNPTSNVAPSNRTNFLNQNQPQLFSDFGANSTHQFYSNKPPPSYQTSVSQNPSYNPEFVTSQTTIRTSTPVRPPGSMNAAPPTTLPSLQPPYSHSMVRHPSQNYFPSPSSTQFTSHHLPESSWSSQSHSYPRPQYVQSSAQPRPTHFYHSNVTSPQFSSHSIPPQPHMAPTSIPNPFPNSSFGNFQEYVSRYSQNMLSTNPQMSTSTPRTPSPFQYRSFTPESPFPFNNSPITTPPNSYMRTSQTSQITPPFRADHSYNVRNDSSQNHPILVQIADSTLSPSAGPSPNPNPTCFNNEMPVSVPIVQSTSSPNVDPSSPSVDQLFEMEGLGSIGQPYLKDNELAEILRTELNVHVDNSDQINVNDDFQNKDRDKNKDNQK